MPSPSLLQPHHLQPFSYTRLSAPYLLHPALTSMSQAHSTSIETCWCSNVLSSPSSLALLLSLPSLCQAINSCSSGHNWDGTSLPNSWVWAGCPCNTLRVPLSQQDTGEQFSVTIFPSKLSWKSDLITSSLTSLPLPPPNPTPASTPAPTCYLIQSKLLDRLLLHE